MKLQRDLCIVYLSFSVRHRFLSVPYGLHLNDLAIALFTTKEDLSLVQQAQVHKNIGTNFRYQSLICMVDKIHLNPSKLSTSDFFSKAPELPRIALVYTQRCLCMSQGKDH